VLGASLASGDLIAPFAVAVFGRGITGSVGRVTLRNASSAPCAIFIDW